MLSRNLSVVVTSRVDRELALQTCKYFSEFCGEVIFVDEQKPFLDAFLINELDKNIKYVPYFSRQKDEWARLYDKRK